MGVPATLRSAGLHLPLHAPAPRPPRRYVTYGEQEWREATEACLKRMELYDDNSERPRPRLSPARAQPGLTCAGQISVWCVGSCCQAWDLPQAVAAQRARQRHADAHALTARLTL